MDTTRSLLLLVGLALVSLLIYLAGTPQPVGLAEAPLTSSATEVASKPGTGALAPTTPSREAATGPLIGERAPDFSLESLSGVEVSLSRLRGLVVILDFWASWSAPCRAAMPSLYAMWQEVADQGVRLVSVSLDRTASDASSYLAANGFDDTTALWGSLAQATTVASLYHVTGIPRTVVIDREGIVRFNDHPGRLDRGMLKGLLSGVR